MSSDDEETLGIFEEPAGYFKPEKPSTYQDYELKDGRILQLRLVGHSPLWVS